MGDLSRYISDPPDARTANAFFKKLGPQYPHHPLHTDGSDPFHTLVATVLSSRTRDPTTNAAMERLWEHAATPEEMLTLAEKKIAELISPVGFYKTKAKHLHQLSRMLLERFDGKVPRTRDELMELPGVGRKVANLVLNICFNTAAICVDIHVHRITNRLGWVETKSPEETEQALMAVIAEKHWTILNRVLVNHGQQVCLPITPHCSKCIVYKYCKRVGVTKSK